jgi:predicted SnoaL-like aldol condensation-catalyzing enzyme
LSGAVKDVPQGELEMPTSQEETNKALVLEAFDALFNRKDLATAERYWSPGYLQHSARVPAGRDGLFDLVRHGLSTMKYENALIMADGDMVMLHGRFSGHGGPRAWIALDIVRIEDGRLAEHWDVIEDEATREDSASGLPMFGHGFPAGEIGKIVVTL